jgi:acetoin utilization deacetylase AcuC-like enzyme
VVTTLLVTHERYLDHVAGARHPERPARLQAVLDGVRAASVDGALVPVEPRAATRDEVCRVHSPAFVDALERLCESGGGRIDADTAASPASFSAAMLAAGAGLEAIERLDAGEAGAAFCAVRPPGHHATPSRAMGFCLLNNVAVAAAALAERGERVLVVDYDAHHGNGTQDAFVDDPRVVYVSLHEYPLYPGTGSLDETGTGDGRGATVNIPLPAGATGDVYRLAVDEIVAPLAEAWDPTWLVVSAGFDGHRRDPLTGLALTSGDFGDLTAELVRLVPPGRRLLFLEGGYDLQGLADSAGAAVAALEGVTHHTEAPSAGGPGRDVVDAALRVRRSAADG